MITMLAQTSFNGNWGNAHEYADFDGDILGVVEWNTTFDNQWYVPTKDLRNIFIAYYGDDQGISQNLIETCTLMLLAGRTAEQEIGAALYPASARVAPLFLDEMQVLCVILYIHFLIFPIFYLATQLATRNFRVGKFKITLIFFWLHILRFFVIFYPFFYITTLI